MHGKAGENNGIIGHQKQASLALRKTVACC
jgi:hypothetical protein